VKRALALIGACAMVYAVVAAWVASQLPAEHVAMHVNKAGKVNQTASRAGAVTYFAGIWGALLLLAVGMLCLIRWTPMRWLNVPHKDYWATPERAPQTRQMMLWDGAVIFSLPFLALSFIPVNILLVTEDPDASGLWIIVPIGIWLLAMLGYVGWMATRRYRPPIGDGASPTPVP
jgi:uncharacterized membrane protein